MTDQKTGVIDPAAGDQGNKTVIAADAKDQPAKVVEPAPVVEKVEVPLEVVKKLQTELKDVKTQNEQLSNQMSLYNANQAVLNQNRNAPQNQPGNTAQPTDPLTGMSDDDVITVADVKKIMQATGGPTTDPALTQRMSVLEVAVQDPNYEQIIRTHLPEMINNPAYAQMIYAVPPEMQLSAALNVAKMNPKYQASIATGKGEQQPVSVADQINDILENAQKPGSPASAGGSVTGEVVNKFKDMTDDQLEAHKQKVMAGKI